MKTKTFDAVEMKRQCQEKAALRHKGLSILERDQKIGDWLKTSDDDIAKWWRKRQGGNRNENQ